MTTDVAEQTQAEAEVPSQTEVATDPTDEQIDADIAALSGGTQGTSSTEGTVAGTEGESDPELEAARAAGREEGERVATEKLRLAQEERDAENERLSYVQSVKSFFDESAPAMRQQLTENELPAEVINSVLNKFVELNGHAQVAALYTMSKELERALANSLPEADREAFHKSQEAKRSAQKWTASGLLEDIKAALTDNARKGYVSETEKKAAHAEGRREVLRLARKDPDAFLAVLNSRKGVDNGNGASVPKSRYTLAEIDAMPMSQWLSIGDQPTRQRLLDEARAAASR